MVQARNTAGVEQAQEAALATPIFAVIWDAANAVYDRYFPVSAPAAETPYSERRPV